MLGSAGPVLGSARLVLCCCIYTVTWTILESEIWHHHHLKCIISLPWLLHITCFQSFHTSGMTSDDMQWNAGCAKPYSRAVPSVIHTCPGMAKCQRSSRHPIWAQPRNFRHCKWPCYLSLFFSVSRWSDSCFFFFFYLQQLIVQCDKTQWQQFVNVSVHLFIFQSWVEAMTAVCQYVFICLFSSHEWKQWQQFAGMRSSVYFPVMSGSNDSKFPVCVHLFIFQSWVEAMTAVCRYLHHAQVQPHHQSDAARCSFTLTDHIATSADPKLTGVWCSDSWSHLAVE